MRQCTLSTCSRKYVAKGYCQGHYDKYRRYGDPLIGEGPKISMADQILKLIEVYEEETRDNIDRIPAEDVIYLFSPQLHAAIYG